jgi:hypothetical protein
MRIVLANSASEAYAYMHRRRPDPQKYLYVMDPIQLNGTCPDEIHIVPGYVPVEWSATELLERIARCVKKLPLRPIWYWEGRPVPHDRGMEILQTLVAP